jgi:tricorn protease
LSAPHPASLLRNQTGKQVLLRIKPQGEEKPRDVVVKPIDSPAESNLRYGEWELTRRERVEELGRGELGYVHLRAMSKDDIAQWAREYYPIHDRKGLIIDVRHNGGGNIDSWILEKLMRKAWFNWQGRAGVPTWNMQYAFRGHMVVLCDEHTGSDGEAFTEGFKRLGLGKVIGKRTWGGEIWLSGSNWLVDRGIATAAEFGVYGPEGQWLIENHGVEPDIVVENLPHATFKGQDAQLDRAIAHLQEEIRRKPVEVPPPPPHPDKSFK